MPSTSLDLEVGSSQIFILNESMQYDPSSVASLKKWIDTDYIVSTRKNKTIYVVKALNNWQANVNTKNAVFFGSTGLDQWAGFATDDTRPDPLNGTFESTPIYGDINSNVLGVAGSLNNGMSYNSNVQVALSGSINVSSNLTYFSGNATLALAPGLPTQLNGANVDARTANITLLQANVAGSTYNWNRLVNANINGNVVVNASCDPCDTTGVAIALPNTFLSGNATTNELYRHQFSLKTNDDAEKVKSHNPIYLVRLERFGKNRTVTNSLSGSLFASKFTDAFYSNVANIAADNMIYSNSLTNCSKIEIMGNIQSNKVNVINSQFSSSQVLGNNTQNVSTNFNTYYSVEINDEKDADMVQGNIQAGETFYANEKVFFVQANLNASVGVFLQGNVNLNANTLILNDEEFTVVNANTVFKSNTSDTSINEQNPKVVTIFGSSLSQTSEWIYSNVYTDVVVPTASGAVTSDNNQVDIDLYVVKGGVNLVNYRSTVTSTKPISGNPFISSVPSYIDDVTFDAEGVSVYDNVNGNGLLRNGNILVDCVQINRNFVYNGNVVSRSCNIAPEYHLFVFGNTKEDERANVDLSSVVFNANSFVANAWSSVVNPSVRITYDDNDVPNSLFLDDDLSKSTPNYKLVFNDWVGKSTLNDVQVLFSPNISLYGNVNDVNANVQLMNSLLPVLNNNPHLKQLCVEDVLYTEFTIAENAGLSWTDQGNICSLDNTNYKYKAILPQYGNITGNLTSSQSAGLNVNDTFLNTIVAYSSYDTINASDVHKLTVHDLQYKAYVSAVKRPGFTDLDNSMTYYANGVDAIEVNANVYLNDTLTSDVVGNISAQSFLTYTYSDMSENSPAEVMYPFFKSDDTIALSNNNITSNVDLKKYLFPGFKYNSSNEFFSYKAAADCDFQIDTSVNVNSHRNFRVFAVDEDNSTVKISLDSSAAKTLPLRPIKLGNRTTAANTTAMNWYSYVTVFLTNSEGRRDYMVLFFRLKDNNSSPNDIPTTLPDDVKNFLPVSVHVKPVGSWDTDKVRFTIAHRAFNNSGVALPQYTSDSDYTAEVDINTFYSPVSTDSSNATVSVNVFSQPINNLIVTMQFLGSTIKDFANYSRTDYDLSENPIEGSTMGGLLANSNNNNTANSVVDTNNNKLLHLGANSTRYYLDGSASGIYFDRPNNVDLTDSFTLRVYRSVSYSLFRDEELVGSGLLSRESSADILTDNIVENLADKKSGFKLSMTHNLVNLSARLHLQSINTLSNQNNNLEFLIQSKVDLLNLNVLSYNPVNNTYIRIEKVENDLPANKVINLSELFLGKLPSITLSSVRGYPYSSDLGLEGSTSPSIGNISKSIFKLKFVPDNYTLYRPSNGKVLNGNNRCVFTSETSPSTNFNFDFLLNYNNMTISTNLANVPSELTRLVTLYNPGLGQVTYIVEDFVGHYNTEKVLSTYSVPSSALELSKNLDHVVDLNTATLKTSNIKNIDGVYSFVIDLGNTNLSHSVEFAGSAFSYPDFVKKCASILYTGTRAIVLHSAKVNSNSTSYASVVSNLWNFTNTRSVFVGQTSALVNSSIVSEQNYTVVLPNSSKTSQTDFAYFSSLKLRTKSFLPPIPLGWAGVYINNSNVDGLKLVVTNGKGDSRTINLTAEYSGVTLRNTEATDDEICDNSSVLTQGLKGYNIKSNSVQMFNMGVSGKLDTINNFVYEINPAKVHFYEANDTNLDSLVNTTVGTGAELTANFLSDVVYNISTGKALSNTIKPSFSYDLDNSTTFANGWLSVLGSTLEMKFNNKFSLGYSLDCFFVVKNNTFAEFDVYEISANSNRANENMNNSIPPYSLTAIKRRRQRISNPDKWAVSNETDTPARSGMSFKLASNSVVTEGDIVNVYCENVSNDNNKLSWTVTNAENSNEKIFSMSSHDDEQYADLLNEALTVE